jgi:hypothetical protein
MEAPIDAVQSRRSDFSNEIRAPFSSASVAKVVLTSRLNWLFTVDEMAEKAAGFQRALHPVYVNVSAYVMPYLESMTHENRWGGK